MSREPNGVGAGGVLKGAILALFFQFFTFSNEKVGIVGAFLEKKEHF